MTVRNKTTILSAALFAGATLFTSIVDFPAAPAEAAVGQVRATLSVTSDGAGGYNVFVSGMIAMSRSEAQGLLNGGYRVHIRIWGSDTASDDLIVGPLHATNFAVNEGMEFRTQVRLKASALDEDIGEDEVYAGVRLVGPDGRTLRSAESNKVTGSF